MGDYFSVALADLDNDADVEIVIGNFVADHTGEIVFEADDWFWNEVQKLYLSASAAADLDDDGDLEVIMGRSAWHHDGTMYYFVEDQEPGYPQIASLDDDDSPEILVTNVREDGTIPLFEPPSWKLLNTYRTNSQIEGGRICNPVPEG